MITLKESILGRTVDKVSTAKKDIDNLKYFGTHFKVDAALVFIKPIDIGGMSLRALKKYSEPDIFFTAEDEDYHYYAQKKAKQLCKYLYAVDLDKLGIDYDKLITDRNTRDKFVSALEDKMNKDGVFKDKYHIYNHDSDRFIKEGYFELNFNRVGEKWATFKIGFYTREQ